MPELDPELRDKIVETHTLVKRIDEEHKEHKTIMNARLRDAKLEFKEYKLGIAETLGKHDTRIGQNEHFRTRILSYTVIITALGSLSLPILWGGVKKFIGSI